MDDQVRTIGIARADKMISDYVNQNQLLTMFSFLLTIIGLAFKASGIPDTFTLGYFIVLIVLIAVQAVYINIHRKKIGIATYLKTLLDRTSSKEV